MSNRYPRKATNARRPVETVTAATRALTARDSGSLFLLNRAAGQAITLPAITGAEQGLEFEFYVLGSITSNTTTITAQSGDLLRGHVESIDTDTSNAHAYYAPDGTDDLIMTLNGSTQGGLVRTHVRFRATDAGQWLVTGQVMASGTPATPFS